MLRKLASPTWALLEYGCYPLLLFISTPWFLHRLGVEKYGHWMLLAATVSLGGALNTGTGAAVIKMISSGIGRSADSEIERTVRSALGISILGGAGLALLVLVIFLSAGSALFVRMGDPSLVMLTGGVAALLIWVEQVDNVFSSAMKGAEHFGQAARVEIASKVMQIIVAAVVLLPWPSLNALYSALIVGAVLRLCAKAEFARRLLRLPRLRPSMKNCGGILRLAKWGWLQGAGGVFFGVADRLFVGSYFGAASLGYYSIASQLAMQIHAATAAALSIVFPVISRKLEEGGHFSLGSAAARAGGVGVIFSSVLAIGLLIFNRYILDLWIGEAQAEPVRQILPYLILAYWLLALNVTPHYILLSIGRFRLVSLTNLAAGCIFVSLVCLVAEAQGVIGVALARSVYGVVIMVNIIPLYHLIRRKSRT